MNGEITGEIIKSAISLKIKDTFKTGVTPNIVYPTIYKEEIKQNLSKPYFFIWAVDVESQKISRNIYEITYQMNVRYHGIDNDPKEYQNLTDKGNRLAEALNTIDVPIWNGTEEIKLPVFSRRLDYKITDGVLQCFVTYVIRAKARLAVGPKMGTLDTNIN